MWIVVDHIGRQFLGYVENPESPVIRMTSPIIMVERHIPPSQIQLQFQPLSHLFDVPEIWITWTTKCLAPETLVAGHDKFITQIRAARAGIEVAGSVPSGLSIVKD